MVEKYPKNSLLGQLEENGFYSNNSKNGELLPFGTLTSSVENSPFKEDNLKTDPVKIEKRIVKNRLNELDCNLFQEGNFIDIQDLDLSKEEKIKKIKNLIDKINEKLYMLEGSDDIVLIEKLKNEKSMLLNALMLLDNKEFNGTSKDDEKINGAEKIFFKIFPVLKKNYLVKKALSKLTMLNESAKKASISQIPYGESEGRYNDFVTYLSLANVIQAKLTKKM